MDEGEVKRPSRIPISLRGKKHELWDSFYFSQLVTNWRPQREVWPFVYGDDGIAAFSAGTALYCAYVLRRHLKLAHYGRVSVYLATASMAIVVPYVTQRGFVTGDIISQKRCTLCTQVKAAGLQVFGGYLAPLLASSLISFYAADRMLTYPVPPLLKAPRELGDLWLKIIRSDRHVFVAIGVLHMLAGVYLAYRKQLCFKRLEIMCNEDIRRAAQAEYE